MLVLHIKPEAATWNFPISFWFVSAWLGLVSLMHHSRTGLGQVISFIFYFPQLFLNLIRYMFLQHIDEETATPWRCTHLSRKQDASQWRFAPKCPHRHPHDPHKDPFRPPKPSQMGPLGSQKRVQNVAWNVFGLHGAPRRILEGGGPPPIGGPQMGPNLGDLTLWWGMVLQKRREESKCW